MNNLFKILLFIMTLLLLITSMGCSSRNNKEISLSITVHENIRYISSVELKKYKSDLNRFNEMTYLFKLIYKVPTAPIPVFLDDNFGISFNDIVIPLSVGENIFTIKCPSETQIYIQNSISKQPLFIVSDQMVKKFTMDGGNIY